MEWKFIGACFMLIWLGKTDSLQPRSNLCKPWRAYTSDCTHQMDISQGGCSATIERNNTVCWDMNFPSWSSPPSSVRHYKLRTYCYNDGHYQRTGLNATINSGSWTEAAFRFKIEGMNYVSCIQFFHNASINDNFMLFYDCIWHPHDLYGEQMKAEYYLKDQKSETMEFGSFHFILPRCHFNERGEHDLDISRHQTFMYVEEKASFSTIHIQKMPVNYQVSSYIIKRCHNCDSLLNKEIGCSNANCTTEENIKTDIDEEEILLKVPNDRSEICFYFTVEAVCHNCSTSNWCVARSILLIPSKTSTTALPFIVVPLCLSTVLALSCIYCIKKLRKVDANSHRRPAVLFVYNPVHDVHVHIIKSIGKLMTHYCGIDVSIADVDIPNSIERNPLVWYNNEVLRADYIAIVSALSCFDTSNSTYNNIFQVGMKIVEQAIKDKKGDKIFNITFPYNLENDVPIITKCSKNFHLMKQFDNMIMYIHNNVNCLRSPPVKLKVHGRINGWIRWKSLPEYLEICKYIENMEEILMQEGSVCLNTVEDNSIVNNFFEGPVSGSTNNIAENISNIAERLVSPPTNNIAQHISHRADVAIEDSGNDLDQEYLTLQELLQRNECSTFSSRETIDSDSRYFPNMHASARNAFVTSVDKFLDVDLL